MPLPFAPKPLPCEGLSSWGARLAAHNHVDSASFWHWLAAAGQDDVCPQPWTLRRLAEVAAWSEREIARMGHGRPAMNRQHLMVPSAVTGLRGVVCPACLAELSTRGDDHYLTADAAYVWRVVCRRHGTMLVDVRDMCWTNERGNLRLVNDHGQPAAAALRRQRTPSALLATCQAAFDQALAGKTMIGPWRTDKPAEYLRCAGELAGPVFWRAGTHGPSFAHLFDEIEGYGRLSFYIPASVEAPLAELAKEPVRSRASAVSAIGCLLMKPEALVRYRSSDLPGLETSEDLFTSLFMHIGLPRLTDLAARIGHWPEPIREPATRAVAALGIIGSESQLFRSRMMKICGRMPTK